MPSLPFVFNLPTAPWRSHLTLDRNHLEEDLCPYTCILPNCPKPESLYTAKDDWKTHLLKDHESVTSWVCFLHDDRVQFDQEDAFIAHILQEHHHSIAGDAFMKLCKRTIPVDLSSCPLCTWPTAEDGEVDKRALMNHIAEDVHAFSLRSLPWAPDDNHESKKQIDYGAAKVGDWLTKYELSAATQDMPPLATIETQSVPHHFDLNEYFSENVESSSGSGSDSNGTMEQELEKLLDEERKKHQEEALKKLQEEGSDLDSLDRISPIESCCLLI